MYHTFVKGSREKELIELSECHTLTMMFVINEKIATSNEETVFWKYFVVFYEHVENNLVVGEVDYGLEKHCSRERTHQATLTKMTMKLEISERQRQLMTNGNDQ